MKKDFLKFLLFYFLACISWGKYAWDLIHENNSILFKVIAGVLLLISLYFLALGLLKLLGKIQNAISRYRKNKGSS